MFEKVKNTLREYVEVDVDSITLETEFLKDLHLNSYDIFTIIGQLEDEFDISIETEALENMITVKDLVDYLSSNT